MRSWAALALAGAVAVVLLAMVTVRTPGTGLAPYPGLALPVTPTSPQAWNFTTERAGLAGLRIWLAEPPPPETALVVTILPANHPTVELAITTLPFAGSASDGAVEAHFDPVWVRDSPYVPTTTLVVRLTADGLPPGAQITVLGSTEGQGPAFTPLYQERPFDRVWPITAMAAGRTGLLGMPSFYALLAYAFLVALVSVLQLAVRASGRSLTP